MDDKTGRENKFGFTDYAENLHGRLAMLGFISLLIWELITGQGILHFWGLI